jgi:multiple sugar transport system substrate-binding protein
MKKLPILFLLSLFFWLPLSARGGQEAEDRFDWKAAEGASIRIFLTQHPFGEAIVLGLPEFEEKTGIRVLYSVTPEEKYFDKVTASLTSHTGIPDVFMVGIYQIWQYAHSDYIQNMDEFLANDSIVSEEYDFKDFFPQVISSLRWDKVPGHSAGTGPLWGLPLVFETNSLAYNKRIFDAYGLEPPGTMDELLEICRILENFDGSGTYALALRGVYNWSTIHSGYMTAYANYGARDYKLENGKLIPQVLSPQALTATKMWVDLIRTGGSPNWSSHTWYNAGADLGAGKAAMLFDADNNSFTQNQFGRSREAGNIRWVRAPSAYRNGDRKANMWIWAMSMNAMSQNKLASWIFLQYFTGKEFTLKAATQYNGLDPVRETIYNSSDFQEFLKQSPGYDRVFRESLEDTAVLITPQPYYMEMAREWSGVIQRLVNGQYGTVKEGMQDLYDKMEELTTREN